jgi:hypothetical protein
MKMPMQRPARAVAAVLISSLLLVACGTAQSSAGVLNGRLGTYGPMGGKWKPLPGKVWATSQSSASFTADVGSDGQFPMNLPVGTYVIFARSPKYQVYQGTSRVNVGTCRTSTPDVAVSAGSSQTVVLQCIEI